MKTKRDCPDCGEDCCICCWCTDWWTLEIFEAKVKEWLTLQ